jgi:hypothetical protein
MRCRRPLRVHIDPADRRTPSLAEGSDVNRVTGGPRQARRVAANRAQGPVHCPERIDRGPLRDGIALALCSFSVLGTVAIHEKAAAAEPTAAETCYRDDTGRIVTRRRPGYVEVPCPAPGEPRRQEVAPTSTPSTEDTGRAPRRQVIERAPPAYISPIPRPGVADFVASVPVPDRWRLVEAIGYKENLWDPYNRNVLKADRPVAGDDWFFNITAISDTVYEFRNVVTPSGAAAAADAGEDDVFGRDEQQAFVENLATEFVFYKGDTTFKPPEWEFRLTPVFNYNYVELEEIQNVNVDPREGKTRTDSFVGLQAALVDYEYHINSERYDFDSVRVGIQPFSSDFRGFLFQDNQLGIRFFGTRHNNVFQYNVAAFRRIEKDTNSGLNDVTAPLRDDDVFIANLYWQDLPVRGFTSQVTAAYNRNRESGEFYFNKNNVLERPASLGREAGRDYDVYYVGYNGDGHFGRLNLTTSLYYAFGEESAGTFVAQETDINAYFAAAELSMDFDWFRARLSLLYGSGDDDPFDDKAEGFDAIFENPVFAGADTSYWIRQSVPLVGGGRIAIQTRNGVLNNFRSSKDEGQSNFTNPGIALAGLGADMDLMPQLRVSFNANYISFAESAVVEVARNAGPVDREIGYDLSVALTWRPLFIQNIVVRASYATLIPGEGFKALFPDEQPNYFLLNAVLTY